MTWQDEARELPFGGSRKIECCKSSASTYINNSPRGISVGPCFRCGYREYEPHGGISPAQLLLWRQADTSVRGMRVRPDCVPVPEWPANVLVWLGKAGLSPERAESEWGIGYSAVIDRVILPIQEGNARSDAFIARSIERSPKYLMSAKAAGKSWYYGWGNTVVIVEDILSAIKVANAGWRVAAALGTSFSQNFLNAAISDATHVVSWLDPDDAGNAAHTKLRRALALWEVDLSRVKSMHDPKGHSVSEIMQYIRSASWVRT